MGSLRSKTEELFSEAFSQLGVDGKFGKVVDSQRPELGQFQCNGALAAASVAKKSPHIIAEEVVTKLSKYDIFESLDIAGPGFINIKIKDEFISFHINSVLSDKKLGYEPVDNPENVVIDFGGPNVAKPMHVGHLRSAIIGDSLQRLFRFIGFNTISDNHMGDWGTQMGMLITELKRLRPDLPYFDENFDGEYPQEPPITISDLEKMYPEASAKCKADSELMAEAVKATDELQTGRRGYVALWKHFVALSVETLKSDFDMLDVKFDYWLGESFYMSRMESLVERLKSEKLAVESEGAIVFPVAEESDKKEIPPVMLVKSGGGFLYGTSDIATIDYRVTEFDADRILYIVDKRQSLHFEQVFRAVRKAAIVKVNIILEHVGFGTVNGSDGRPFKTREGGVMKLKDLIELVTTKAKERMSEAGIGADYSSDEFEKISGMVGIAALKFADLMNHRESDYVFDIDRFSKFEGKTGPYILYSAVRIKSILRNATAKGFKSGKILPPTTRERNLSILLSKFPDVIVAVTDSYTPNYICDYVYELAQEFNRFYGNCHIINEEDELLRESWLALCELTLKTFMVSLDILGISVPERM